MMASSAASSTVKSARKMKNVTATGVAAMCDPDTQAPAAASVCLRAGRGG